MGLVPAGAAVAVVGVLAIGMAVADDDAGQTADGPSWDSIAVIDRETGVVTFVDRQGNALGGEIDTGVVEPGFIFGESGQLAIAGLDVAAVVDVAAGTVEAPAVPSGTFASRLATSELLVLAAAPPEGGDATLVTATNSVDVAQAAGFDDPLIFQGAIRANLAGTLFAVGDSRSFQTAIVGSERDGVLVPGLPFGITDDYVVTVEADGRESRVRFSSVEGRRISAMDAPLVAAGLVGPTGDVIVVTESGEVLGASPGDDEMRDLTALDLDGDVRGGFAALHGQRLLVVADRGIALLDDQGDVVATLELDDQWRPPLLVSSPWQRCAVVVSERGTATMLDLETGETLGSAEDVTLVQNWSTDGCTASLIRGDENSAISRQGVEVPLGPGELVAAIAPDGDHVVVRDRTGAAWLRNLDDEGAEDVALGRDRDALYAFVDH
jgi:hypothetical protein